MATIELKKYLVSKINLLEDDLILNKIKKLVENNQKQYVLNPEQLNSIAISEQQILMGKFINQDEMDKKFESWLTEK